MKDKVLSALLNEYDKKISQSLSINAQLLGELKTEKAYSRLKKLLSNRFIELIIGLIFSFVLGNFLYKNWHSPGLAISSGIIMAFTIFALSGCIRQIYLISKFDLNQPIIENQKILAMLQSFIIIYLRIGLLQFPFYLAYISIAFRMFFGIDMWQNGNLTWLIIQLAFSVLLIPISLWIFKKISHKNMNIHWVKYLIESSGGKTVTRAMEFLNEIEDYKTE
jgi:hypothetical protein